MLYITIPNWKTSHLNFYSDYTHIRLFTPFALLLAFQDFGFIRVSAYLGLRCKPDWYNQCKFRSLQAYYLLPFRVSVSFLPCFFKRHARSIICIAQKP